MTDPNTPPPDLPPPDQPAPDLPPAAPPAPEIMPANTPPEIPETAPGGGTEEWRPHDA